MSHDEKKLTLSQDIPTNKKHPKKKTKIVPIRAFYPANRSKATNKHL